MITLIPKIILEYYGITYDELLYLILKIRGPNLKDIEQSLLNKGIGKPSIKGNLVTKMGDHILLNSILSKTSKINKMNAKSLKVNPRILNLAKRMQEEYPTGRKPGTAFQWRDSSKVIASRLVTFINKYDIDIENEYTDDDFVEATKKYVESFNGNYTYMQLLKYFICKRVIVCVDGAGVTEENSQLMSYLENKDSDDFRQDWATTLR